MDHETNPNGDGAPIVARKTPHGPPAILALSDGSRPGAHDAALLDLAVVAALALDVDVSVLDLLDLDLPIYDSVLNAEPMPQGVLVIRQIVSAHDGLLIVSPEDDDILSPLLRNALDWSSRPTFRADGLAPYRGKLAMLMSVAADPSVGSHGLAHLSTLLSNMGVHVLPEQLPIPEAAFADGTVTGLVRHRIGQFVLALRVNAGRTDRP